MAKTSWQELIRSSFKTWSTTQNGMLPTAVSFSWTSTTPASCRLTSSRWLSLVSNVGMIKNTAKYLIRWIKWSPWWLKKELTRSNAINLNETSSSSACTRERKLPKRMHVAPSAALVTMKMTTRLCSANNAECLFIKVASVSKQFLKSIGYATTALLLDSSEALWLNVSCVQSVEVPWNPQMSFQARKSSTTRKLRTWQRRVVKAQWLRKASLRQCNSRRSKSLLSKGCWALIPKVTTPIRSMRSLRDLRTTQAYKSC